MYLRPIVSLSNGIATSPVIAEEGDYLRTLAIARRAKMEAEALAHDAWETEMRAADKHFVEVTVSL